MRFNFACGASIALALVAVGCQDPVSAPARTPAARASLAVAAAPATLTRGSSMFGRQHTADLAHPAINPNDYVCDDESPIVDWWLGAAIDFIQKEPAIFNVVYNQLLGDVIALDYPGYFETTANPQSFGITGQFTKAIGKTERDIKAFWDVPSSDIQVVAAHGRVLTDVAKVSATYQADFGVPPSLGDALAGAMRNAVLASHVLNGGDHPLFTFNAYAAWEIGVGIPDKIVFGDAILEGYQAVGLGDVAPQAVFAHEFSHHIQNRRGYFNDPAANAGSGAEQTRYTELMADAFAGYFLTHKRGAAMNRKRVEQFLNVFFEIGDCAFTDAGHHGTPNQRMKASRFGFDIADAAQKQGQILTANQFHTLFLAYYPTLIAPDAP